VGNPHLVLLGPDVADVHIAELGPMIQSGFPDGVNVEWIAPVTDELGELLEFRVWERGVGETLACGTGACAVAVAVHSWGQVGSRVLVHSPGGTLQVEVLPDGVSLAGPTQKVAELRMDTGVLTELALTYDDELALASDTLIENPVVPGP